MFSGFNSSFVFDFVYINYGVLRKRRVGSGYAQRVPREMAIKYFISRDS